MMLGLMLAVAMGAEPQMPPPSLVFSNAHPRILNQGTQSFSTNTVFEVTEREMKISGSVLGRQLSIHSGNSNWVLAGVQSLTPSVTYVTNGTYLAFVASGTAQISATLTNNLGQSTNLIASGRLDEFSGDGSVHELLSLAPGSLAADILRSSLALTNGQSPLPPKSPGYSAFSSPMQYDFGKPPPDPKWTNWTYQRNAGFWLNGVAGLEALNVFPYQMQLALVTPRHCLTVEHMRGCGSNVMVCFVGTNNITYWRRSLGTVAIGDHLRACILDAPVPITPMPLLSDDTLAHKIGMLRRTEDSHVPVHSLSMILFNQFWQAWAGDAGFSVPGVIGHFDHSLWLSGWSWAVPGQAVVGGDSGSARCFVIDRQLYLAGICQSLIGEVTLKDINQINAGLDQLSADTGQPKNHVTVFDDRKYPSY